LSDRIRVSKIFFHGRFLKKNIEGVIQGCMWVSFYQFEIKDLEKR
jgi:hypothetical protein